MSLRLIGKVTGRTSNRTAKIYRDAEWQEYRVKFFDNDRYQEEADHHTDDKPDALATAQSFCR